MARVWKGLLAICGFCVLSACGGGGDAGSLSVTYTPTPIQASSYKWDLPLHVEVDATVQGSTSASTIYVLIADSDNTFVAGQVGIENTGPNTYKTMLTVPASIPVGVHSGNLTIRICADSSCNKVLNDSTLPYQVTVQGNPSLQAVASPTTLSGSAINNGSATMYGGELPPVSWKLPTFTLQGTPVYPIYVRASDPNGVLHLLTDVYSAAANTAGPFNDNNFQLAFSVTDHLPLGSYNGTLSFTLCHDPQCTKVFIGSSTLPYALSYGAGNLTTLSPIANAPDWQGTGGSASHNGSVPITVSADNFSLRWAKTSGYNAPDNSMVDRGLLTGGGNVYLMNGSLVALNENDGGQVWYNQYAYSRYPMVSANNTIYLNQISTDGSGYTTFYGINAANGAQLFAKNSIQASSPPVAINNQVLFQSLDSSYSYYQFHGFNGQSGNETGSPACLKAIEQANHLNSGLLPTLDAQLNAYIPTSGGVVIANFGVNPSCSQIPASLASTSPTYLGSNSNLLVNNGTSLVDLSATNSTVNWTVAALSSMSFVSNATAIANGVVYVAAYNYAAPRGKGWAQLQARSETDGHLLWTWDSPDLSYAQFTDGLIVTNNLVLAQINRHVYAIDLNTHQAVWSVNVGGPMAISANGILYVNGQNLLAVNLH